MTGDLTATLTRLEQAFASYPRRAVLEGCPHCRPSTSVHEHDLFSLSISLGNTVGDRDDVKSLLPLLFERLLTSTELDADIVLGKLPREEWRSWPAAEQQAVDEYLDAVWRALLAEFPSRLGSFVDAAEFVRAVPRAEVGVERFLAVWDSTVGSAADRHLAQLVSEFDFSARRRDPTVAAWLCRVSVRDRLLAAFERDHGAAWADELAHAYDVVRLQSLAPNAG